MRKAIVVTLMILGSVAIIGKTAMPFFAAAHPTAQAKVLRPYQDQIAQYAQDAKTQTAEVLRCKQASNIQACLAAIHPLTNSYALVAAVGILPATAPLRKDYARQAIASLQNWMASPAGRAIHTASVLECQAAKQIHDCEASVSATEQAYISEMKAVLHP